jgi:hypothetical protein
MLINNHEDHRFECVACLQEFRPDEQRYFVLGLPTGGTPLGMYKNLVRAHKAGKVTVRLGAICLLQACGFRWFYRVPYNSGLRMLKRQ